MFFIISNYLCTIWICSCAKSIDRLLAYTRADNDRFCLHVALLTPIQSCRVNDSYRFFKMLHLLLYFYLIVSDATNGQRDVANVTVNTCIVVKYPDRHYPGKHALLHSMKRKLFSRRFGNITQLSTHLLYCQGALPGQLLQCKF